LVRPASFRDPGVEEELRGFAPDLQVMAFVTQIVPAGFLSVPTQGTIQYHPSLLPRHRGRSAINWPVIKGETETGLTIFWPDGGIDTGDVLLQRATPISETDTLGSVYFERLLPMGVEAVLEAVDLVAAGTAPRIPQDERLATYEAPCEKANARLDWGKPVKQLHDLVRGCSPAPGAWTTCGGQALQVLAATPQPARDVAGLGGAMGEVVDVGEDWFSVVCADGRLRLTRVRPAGGAKMGAGEWAAEGGLSPGARLV
jgi:methionyl-tRNA formyltransferase